MNNYAPIFDGDVSQFGKVAVLYGGVSAERSVSLKSGEQAISALRDAGVDVLAIDVQENAIETISNHRFDSAFIALHGGDGEGGKIQALLELMNIPYTGSNHAASALALNKLHTKEIWLSRGLPTPEFTVVDSRSDLEAVWSSIGECFVKPISEGSSYGISPAKSVTQLHEAVALASKFSESVIVEKFIDGPEYSVSVLGDTVLPAIQIVNNAEFYDFHAKYESDATQYLCPAPISEDDAALLSHYTKQAFSALECSGWGRIDFMQDKIGEFYLLEANTVPGMTDHSLVPMAAKAVGLSYQELVLEILSYMKRGSDA